MTGVESNQNQAIVKETRSSSGLRRKFFGVCLAATLTFSACSQPDTIPTAVPDNCSSPYSVSNVNKGSSAILNLRCGLDYPGEGNLSVLLAKNTLVGPEGIFLNVGDPKIFSVQMVVLALPRNELNIEVALINQNDLRDSWGVVVNEMPLNMDHSIVTHWKDYRFESIIVDGVSKEFSNPTESS